MVDEGSGVISGCCCVALLPGSTSLLERKQFSEQAFALIFGQCSRPLQDRLIAHPKWNEIKAKCQFIELLEIIRDSLFARGIGQEPDHARIEANMKINSLAQNRDNASVYHAKFRQIVESIMSLGSKIGITPESRWMARASPSRKNRASR
eukprot:scaffold16512_cov168-Cylindrotheca_fusiformis.AAC.1